MRLIFKCYDCWVGNEPLKFKSRAEAIDHLFTTIPRQHKVRMEIERIPEVLTAQGADE